MDIKDKIRVIEDFPTEGISFKDITTLIKDKDAFACTVDMMCGAVIEMPDVIVAAEARGFIFGSAMAYKLGLGFVPIRKAGKLPAETAGIEYVLEYGSDEMQIHKDAISKGTKVLLVDDLIATGGTMLSAARLVEKLHGEVSQIISLIELTELNGRAILSDYDVTTFVKYAH